MEARQLPTRDKKALLLLCPLCKRVLGEVANLNGESVDVIKSCRHCKRRWTFTVRREDGRIPLTSH